ncbi:MAG: hypothetical protein H6Q90_5290 [Deltaproteobacteria bacterium]|nr:hypothetical protein [Deltaproteobacteria bacterium]
MGRWHRGRIRTVEGVPVPGPGVVLLGWFEELRHAAYLIRPSSEDTPCSTVPGMIPAAPRGWTQRFSANLVVYEAPDGGSRIRCHQQMPLEPISKAVARVAGDARIEDTRRVVSGEGEYGALCRVGERVVAVLFADAHAIVIEGSVRHADVVLDLLIRWKLELGLRPRRALYEPPPGWRPMPNALATTWFPPGFPGDHAELVIYPTAPTTSTPHDELAQLIAVEAASLVGEIREVPLETEHGLIGTHATLAIAARGGVVVHRDLVLLRREPYRYALKLEWTGEARHREVLLAVVRSLQPLPVQPSRDGASQVHWVD